MLEAATPAEKATVSDKPSTLSSPHYKPKRYFTKGLDDTNAFNHVEWELRDVVIKNFKGETVFEQKNVEVPKSWTQNATTIVASKYFRGHGEDREHSVKQLIDRVVTSIAEAGVKHRYFSKVEAQVLEDELRFLCLHQMMAFNSPVWFNVGTQDDPQCSACFILDLQDNMDSILNWYKEEGKVFQRGSGAGLNISNLREKNSKLSGGGFASGPLSFAEAADKSAGTIKSGGKTRRAAKMLVMDVDHPDIEDFVATKVEAEKVVQALMAAGYSSDFTDENGAYALAPWQNANNSVRVTDEFMEAVKDGKMFALRSRGPDGGVARMVNASDLFRKTAEAAWSCGDPGLQFHDTVNKMHTCPSFGDIVASNPCSEYMFLNNTACNLASLNLMKFAKEDWTFDVEAFVAATEITIAAMEIIVAMSSYPTETITSEAKKYRTLGIGFANLGALLMSSGLAYDSKDGREYAAAIMSLLSSVGYRVSGEIAEKKGSFTGFFDNQDAFLGVLENHEKAHQDLAERAQDDLLQPLLSAAEDEWGRAVTYASNTGLRNAQISVLAPTGTISFMMDCDTTGIEPDLALVKYKKLVGGGSMKIVNQTVGPALKNLSYSDEEVADIVEYIHENDTIEGAPHLRQGHLAVFDCSLKPANGERSISPMGHIDMMAACQPFISGAISKTVNMPRESTVEDVMDVYMKAWEKGLKAMAIYRDGCKESQPLNVGAEAKKAEAPAEVVVKAPARERLPDNRMAGTHKFSIAGHDGYLTLGYYEDGRLGELFVTASKQGSTLNGLMDAWATMVSLGLQYGIPLDTIVDKFKHTKFEPAGFTGNPEIRSTSSILDYIVRHMEQMGQVDTEGGLMTVPHPKEEETEAKGAVKAKKAEPLVTGPPCSDCGAMTVRSGACYKCDNCGSTTGCG